MESFGWTLAFGLSVAVLFLLWTCNDLIRQRDYFRTIAQNYFDQEKQRAKTNGTPRIPRTMHDV